MSREQERQHACRRARVLARTKLVARACQLGYLNVPASGNSSEGENVGAEFGCNKSWGKRGQEVDGRNDGGDRKEVNIDDVKLIESEPPCPSLVIAVFIVTVPKFERPLLIPH